MPKLSRLLIKSALLYLLIGLSIGALILLQKGWLFLPMAWRLLPIHIELVIFGWILQLVMGVAFWMLPRFGREPLRGNEKPVWATFFLINGGILLNCLAVLIGISMLALAGRVLEIGAVLSFVIHAWPRVKPFAE